MLTSATNVSEDSPVPPNDGPRRALDGPVRGTSGTVGLPDTAIQVTAVGLATVIAVAGVAVLAMNPAGGAGIALVLAGLFAALLVLYAWQRGALSHGLRGRVWFDEAGLHLADDLVVMAGDIRTLRVMGRPDMTGRIGLRSAWYRAPIHVDVESVERAWELTERVSYGPARRATVYRLTPTWEWMVAYFITYMGSWLLAEWLRWPTVLHKFAVFSIGMLFLFGPVLLVLRRKTVVAADGVLIRRWRRDRFVSYRSIRSIDAGHRFIDVQLDGGKRLRLGRSNEAEGQALVLALTHALERYRKCVAPDDVPAQVLERPYHEAADLIDRLRALIANPVAHPRIRATAALALRKRSHEATDQIRAIASNTASDRLRAALEAAAELDEEAMEARLSGTESDARH